MKQNLIILGATGSLGTQTLEVLASFLDHFQVTGLLANKNEDKLHKLAVSHPAAKLALATKNQQINLSEADIIVNVLPGMAGIPYTLEALRLGKTLLLGNKESLVAEGEKVMELSRNARLIPLDSEHNAIYEMLKHATAPCSCADSGCQTNLSDTLSVQKSPPVPLLQAITLTASGGPFYGKTSEELAQITPEQALSHPTWNMGPKVTIESATLLNKGLETIEAHYLFGLPLEKIHVRIDRTSQIHAIAHFEDGTNLAYKAEPNMRHHIENALCRAIGQTSPRTSPQASSAIVPISQEEIEALPLPDHKTFPGIKIVQRAFQKSSQKNAPKDPSRMESFLKREESTINNFLTNKISFLEIFKAFGR